MIDELKAAGDCCYDSLCKTAAVVFRRVYGLSFDSSGGVRFVSFIAPLQDECPTFYTLICMRRTKAT